MDDHMSIKVLAWTNYKIKWFEMINGYALSYHLDCFMVPFVILNT